LIILVDLISNLAGTRLGKKRNENARGAAVDLLACRAVTSIIIGIVIIVCAE